MVGEVSDGYCGERWNLGLVSEIKLEGNILTINRVWRMAETSLRNGDDISENLHLNFLVISTSNILMDF